MAKLLKKAKVIFIIGGPNSGKSTVGLKMAKDLDFAYVNLGDHLRKEVSNDTPLGAKVKTALEKGEMLSNAEIIPMLKELLAKEISGAKGIVVSGFPKDVAQAQQFDKDIPVRELKVVNIKATEETMKARLAAKPDEEKRMDDSEEAMATRMTLYLNNEKAIMDFYNGKKKRGCEVDGEGTIDDVLALVRACVEPPGKKK